MSGSTRKRAALTGASAAVTIMMVWSSALAVQPTPATINQWVKEVAGGPRLSQEVILKYRTAMTINLPLSRDYQEAIRQVLEKRVAGMVTGRPRGLKPAPPSGTSPEEVRRRWRASILDDARAATSPYFREEMTRVLTPVLTALALGYNDPAGQPDRAVRVCAVHLLVRLPGPHQEKTEAMLRLLRQKGVDQGSLFLVIRQLGRRRIAAAVPTLLGVLSGKNAVLQAAAARALGLIGDEQALEPLLEALRRSGDTVRPNPEEARNLVLAVIEGIRGVAVVNQLDEKTRAKVVAALMRRVLTDPDRTVVCAAAAAIQEIAAYPETLSPVMPEDQYQAGIERMRAWWLRQKGARKYYEEMFRLEPIPAEGE